MAEADAGREVPPSYESLYPEVSQPIDLIPTQIRDIIEDQLKALHEICLQPPYYRSYEQCLRIIQPLVNPSVCMKCFGIHGGQVPCLEKSELILPKYKGYREVSVVFPFRKARTFSNKVTRKMQIYHFGRIIVRVMDGGYLDRILRHPLPWRYMFRKFPQVWVKSQMIMYGSDQQQVLLFVTPTTLINPEDPRTTTNIPILPLEEYREQIFTLTPSRACFLTWMEKQMQTLLRFYSHKRWTDQERAVLLDDLENPPICKVCGSWHNYRNSPCFPNILTLQQHVPISRNIRLRYAEIPPPMMSYYTVDFKILDGGNFKRACFHEGWKAHWTRFRYQNGEQDRNADIAMVLPDAFLIRDEEVPREQAFSFTSNWREGCWLKFWYTDPTPEKLAEYLSADSKESKVACPQSVHLHLTQARVDATPEFFEDVTHPWQPNNYFTELSSRAITYTAIRDRWDESMEEVKEGIYFNVYDNRDPLPTPVPFLFP